MSAYLILTVLLILGYFNHNSTICIATCILFVMKLLFPVKALEFMDAHGMHYGIILLTAGMLAPIALGKITIQQIIDTFKSMNGILSVLVGVLVAVFGAWGVDFIREDPQAVVAVLVGTIIGVAFFHGIPVGPLIAGGIVLGGMRLAKVVLSLFK